MTDPNQKPDDPYLNLPDYIEQQQAEQAQQEANDRAEYEQVVTDLYLGQ